MNDTQKLESMTKDEVIQYYKTRSEGYQAIAETLFARISETVIIAGEALSSLKHIDESVGVKVDTGLSSLLSTVRQVLGKTVPQTNSMNDKELLEFLQNIMTGGLL